MSGTPRVFSPAWGLLVREAINASPGYRSKGAAWTDLLALEMDPPTRGPNVAVLDLREGSCASVACDAEASPEGAAFRIAASAEQWRRVLDGSLEPIWGIMSGKLRLSTGSVAALVPHAEAARELVAAIATVPAAFPGGATGGAASEVSR